MFQSPDKKDIYYKTDDELELMRAANILNCKAIALAGSLIAPGVSGIFLDREVETFIRDSGGIPAFKGYRGFPNTLTVSINDQVVHGIPSQKEIKEGDVVSVDWGVNLNGYYGDAAYTYAVVGIDASVMRLLEVTKKSVHKAIEQAIIGKRMGDIGFAVFDYCERLHKFGVVRDLIGIGKSMHEEPDVPNHGKRGSGFLLRKNLVIAIEPMINMGTKDVRIMPDGWTILTKDGKPSAHFEHSIAVRSGQADILSDHSFIEDAEKKNTNLLAVQLIK